jgi:hypothetical protein
MRTIDDLTTGIQFPPLFSLASPSFSEQPKSSNPAGAPHARSRNLSNENHDRPSFEYSLSPTIRQDQTKQLSFL